MVCCWKAKEKRSHKEKILKEASKTGGQATVHLHETLLSLVNAGISQVTK